MGLNSQQDFESMRHGEPYERKINQRPGPQVTHSEPNLKILPPARRKAQCCELYRDRKTGLAQLSGKFLLYLNFYSF